MPDQSRRREVSASDLEQLYSERRARDEWRLKRMLCYAENTTCRTAQILRYFEEEVSRPCCHCDGCEGRGASDLGKLPPTVGLGLF